MLVKQVMKYVDFFLLDRQGCGDSDNKAKVTSEKCYVLVVGPSIVY